MSISIYKIFVENWKTIVFVILVSLTTLFFQKIFKKILQNKRKRDIKNFSDPNYSIAAALTNMERAIFYSDDDNFKFFIRYIIRTCLGLPKSYPPDEPPIEIIVETMDRMNISTELSKKILALYNIDELPNDSKGYKKIISDTQSLANNLLFEIKHKMYHSSIEQASEAEKNKNLKGCHQLIENTIPVKNNIFVIKATNKISSKPAKPYHEI